MELKIRKPDDMHLHLRQGESLKYYLAAAQKQFARAVVMPNTEPPLISPQDLKEYRALIVGVSSGGFQPLMTFFLTDTTTDVAALKRAGAVAGKYYPQGATTNSRAGTLDWRELTPLLEAMEKNELILCVHGEVPREQALRREQAFFPILKEMVKRFPRLRIILEHVSTRQGVELVKALPATVAATITVHHLCLTLDDLIGETINPHHFCKPLVKSKTDQESLIKAVLAGSSKFFLGTDSAPHPRARKESAHGPAGIFSSPVAMPLLAGLFEQNAALNRLEDFTSRFGAEFYGLPLNRSALFLRKEPWQVPGEYHGVVPLKAGEILAWQVKE